jgi:hypothetical protein
MNTSKQFTLPRIFVSKGGVRSEARLRPVAYGQAATISRCAPAATNPKVLCNTVPPVQPHVGRGIYLIGSLQKLPHTICDLVVPLVVAFYTTQ